jgi:hypothetical protein
MVDNKDYRLAQGELRSRLIVIMKYSEQPVNKIAKEIGIVPSTLKTFMEGKDTDWPRLCRIEKYIVKYENYLEYHRDKKIQTQGNC